MSELARMAAVDVAADIAKRYRDPDMVRFAMNDLIDALVDAWMLSAPPARKVIVNGPDEWDWDDRDPRD